MAKPKILHLAERWTPAPNDPSGEDKRRLVKFLLENDIGAGNPMTIKTVMTRLGFSARYSREAFQHQLLGPLRRDPRVFVGTSSRGIFLIKSAEDADTTLGFYTWRIRAELRHARNLRALTRRARLMEGHQSSIPKKKERATIYFDESGSPDLQNLSPPVFVVAAVMIESRQDVAGLEQRFKNAFAAIRRSEEHEMRSSALSERKHFQVLRELSLLDYQWAAACFDKRRLNSLGLANPAVFYRWAFQFLVGELLTVAWQADLVIDENSTTAFQAELERHLREQNSGLPVTRLGSVTFAQSNRVRLVQLADLVAGAVRRDVGGEGLPLREIEHKMIDLRRWPPRMEDAP